MTCSFLVSVRCFTYNQSAYIKDALNGFVVQQTNFPFVVLVVDDASTDGEQEVIRKFMAEEFDLSDTSVAYEKETEYAYIQYAQHKTNKNCFMVAMFLKENHYSQKKKKFPYLAEWRDGVKYEAICEGDDYWIDPLKLQKQVDFLEKNPAFLMSVSKACFFSETNKEFVFMPYNAEEQSVTLKPANVILKGGLYINTCSIVYRSELDNYMKRKYIKNSPIGDYPLQIVAAMEGKIFYFGDSMCVYRVNNNQSWVGRQAQIDIKTRVDRVCDEVEMLLGFAKDYPVYEKYFKRRINFYLNSQYRLSENRDYLDCGFSKYEHFRTFFWKMDRYAIKKNIKLLLRITNLIVRRIMIV
jgi:glycosyltransferase involved in cell wall biosynthesis